MSDITSHFVLPKQSILSQWAEALPIVLCESSGTGKGESGWLGHVFMEYGRRPSTRTFLVSTLCHLTAVVLLLYVPTTILFSAPRPAKDQDVTQDQVIYYDLRSMHLEKTLPNVSSPGTGGKPGRGSRPKELPLKGSDAFHSRLTIAMNPLKPDSHRQTIIQPSSPPQLKISQDLKLPNLMIGSLSAPQMPQVPMALKQPIAPAKSRANTSAPAVLQTVTPSPLHLAALPDLLAPPQITVPVLPMPAPESKPQVSGAGAAGQNLPDVAVPGSLLAIGVNPSALEDMIAVPPGNRYGAFSVAPAGSQPGSPGGVADGVAHGGNGGGPKTTGAGDGSSATGTRSSGGAGNSGGLAISVSGGTEKLAGKAAIDAGDHALIGAVAAEQIFPVLAPAHVRGLNIQVFAGPTGGGGLAVYHVLPCDKIYTTMLGMPGKDWILQYCTQNMPDASGVRQLPNQTLRMNQGLIAPDPLARFDFKRPVLSVQEKAKLIVLRAAIAKDGSVADVSVLDGVDPIADKLAAAAFHRWKFQPALRSGKAVRVEVLVGVPATKP